jgi:hypothetical protein
MNEIVQRFHVLEHQTYIRRLTEAYKSSIPREPPLHLETSRDMRRRSRQICNLSRCAAKKTNMTILVDKLFAE